jgi:hypothetical protein
MTTLEVAVRRRDWERVALYLLLGVSRAADKLPPESLNALLDLLSVEKPRGGRDAG